MFMYVRPPFAVSRRIGRISNTRLSDFGEGLASPLDRQLSRQYALYLVHAASIPGVRYTPVLLASWGER
jgi:hypothetical protein